MTSGLIPAIRSLLPVQVVDHDDPAALDVEDLHLFNAQVVNPNIVVASGGENGRDLLQPIEDDRLDDVSGMQDEVDAGERLARFLPEGCAVRRLVCIRNQSNQHACRV